MTDEQIIIYAIGCYALQERHQIDSRNLRTTFARCPAGFQTWVRGSGNPAVLAFLEATGS